MSAKESVLHPALPPLPRRMVWLPVDPRGFPVPYFVTWFHANGEAFDDVHTPLRAGDYPDFRVISRQKMALCHRNKLCWVCGNQLGKYLAFTVGPMCIVNRTSGEPPAHRECATFSARACPFLTKPMVERRENNIPADGRMHPACLERNPGCAAVYVTTEYGVNQDKAGNVTFWLGDPSEVEYYCEGRPATRAEIMHSIDTGMPFLREMAAKQPEGLSTLERMYAEAMVLVPGAGVEP